MRLGRVRVGCGDLQSEADPRQFAARGDLGKRTGRVSGVQCHGEFDAIVSGRAVLGRLIGRRIQGNEKAAGGHAELLDIAVDFGLQRGCCRAPGSTELCRRLTIC